MGESMEKVVATITDLIEANLMKLAEAKMKQENDSSRISESSRISPKGGASASATGGGFGASASSVDSSIIKPSQMMVGAASERDENSLEPDEDSDDMEEIE